MPDEPSPVVRALAATDPADLIHAVSTRLEALALQHDALRVVTLQSLKDVTVCGCPECQLAAGQLLSNLALIERDQQRLELAAALVGGITAYGTPDPASLCRAVEGNAHVDAVNRLERALDAPAAEEGHAA